MTRTPSPDTIVSITSAGAASALAGLSDLTVRSVKRRLLIVPSMQLVNRQLSRVVPGWWQRHGNISAEIQKLPLQWKGRPCNGKVQALQYDAAMDCTGKK
jgi:hypothetical protein